MDLIHDARCSHEVWNIDARVGAMDIERGGSPALTGRIRATVNPVVVDFDARADAGWALRMGICAQTVFRQPTEKHPDALYMYIRVDGGSGIERDRSSDPLFADVWTTVRVAEVVAERWGLSIDIGTDARWSRQVGVPVRFGTRVSSGLAVHGIGFVVDLISYRTIGPAGWSTSTETAASLVYVIGGKFPKQMPSDAESSP